MSGIQTAAADKLLDHCSKHTEVLGIFVIMEICINEGRQAHLVINNNRYKKFLAAKLSI